MLMSFVQLWLMSGAQQRCRLWSLRRVQMHSGTSDWLKSTVHQYIFQVNKYALWRHSRKQDKRHAIWYSGTNAFVETVVSIFRTRKAMVLAWGSGSGSVICSKCDYLHFQLTFDLKMEATDSYLPTAQHHLSEASRTVSEPKAPGTMLSQYCPIHVLSIQCMSLTAISFLIFQAAAFQQTCPPNLCKLFMSQSA